MGNQRGFTLIELVVVIVILGILAAVALPRYVDMTTQARQAAVDGVAGGLASASAINYAAALARGAIFGTTTGAGAPVQDTMVADACDNAVAALLVPEYDGGSFTLTPDATAIVNVGDTATCTVTGPGGEFATFTMYGAQ